MSALAQFFQLNFALEDEDDGLPIIIPDIVPDNAATHMTVAQFKSRYGAAKNMKRTSSWSDLSSCSSSNSSTSSIRPVRGVARWQSFPSPRDRSSPRAPAPGAAAAAADANATTRTEKSLLCAPRLPFRQDSMESEAEESMEAAAKTRSKAREAASMFLKAAPRKPMRKASMENMSAAAIALKRRNSPGSSDAPCPEKPNRRSVGLEHMRNWSSDDSTDTKRNMKPARTSSRDPTKVVISATTA